MTKKFIHHLVVRAGETVNISDCVIGKATIYPGATVICSDEVMWETGINFVPQPNDKDIEHVEEET